MLEFFTSISDAVTAAVSALGSIVSNTLSVFRLIGDATVFLGLLVGFLPQLLGVFALATIAVCIVFLLIGR